MPPAVAALEAKEEKKDEKKTKAKAKPKKKTVAVKMEMPKMCLFTTEEPDEEWDMPSKPEFIG